MKKYVFTLFAIILLGGTSCQEKIDIEKEKATIIAVIEEETEAFFDSDIDRLGALHVQDETNIRLTATKSGYTSIYTSTWNDEEESETEEIEEGEVEPETEDTK